jgi:hypothetical protein
MATTTTNFGWDIPQSTDLVKDGATAIAALGQDIDTAFVDLKGGTTGQVLAKASGTDLDFSWVAQDDSNAIQNAIVDAKGDLIAASAADTPARLAVGTNGQVLTADSTAGTGLAWTTPSAGGMTLLQTLSLSGVETVTSSSIPSTYTNLVFVVKNVYWGSSNNSDLGMRFNSDTGSNYNYRGFFEQGGSASGDENTNVTAIGLCTVNTLTGGASGNGLINVYRYTDTTGVLASVQTFGNLGGTTYRAANRLAYYNGSSAISTVTFYYSQGGGNFANGTIYIYGVK